MSNGTKDARSKLVQSPMAMEQLERTAEEKRSRASADDAPQCESDGQGIRSLVEIAENIGLLVGARAAEMNLQRQELADLARLRQELAQLKTDAIHRGEMQRVRHRSEVKWPDGKSRRVKKEQTIDNLYTCYQGILGQSLEESRSKSAWEESCENLLHQDARITKKWRPKRDGYLPSDTCMGSQGRQLERYGRVARQRPQSAPHLSSESSILLHGGGRKKNSGRHSRHSIPDPQSPPQRKKNMQLNQIQDMFDKFDHDGSGYLDRFEIKKLADVLGARLSASDLNIAILEMDKDNTGDISFDEFYDWFDRQTHEHDGSTLGRSLEQWQRQASRSVHEDLLREFSLVQLRVNAASRLVAADVDVERKQTPLVDPPTLQSYHHEFVSSKSDAARKVFVVHAIRYAAAQLDKQRRGVKLGEYLAHRPSVMRHHRDTSLKSVTGENLAHRPSKVQSQDVLTTLRLCAALTKGKQCADLRPPVLHGLSAFMARNGGGRNALQVRKTPSWPRSWVNFSLF
jgi:hypothetical protein